jgi:ankyrin repeat protein
MAVIHDSIDVLRYLLVDCQLLPSMDVNELAFHLRSPAAARLLVDHCHANFNYTHNGQTILHKLASAGNKRLLRWLLKRYPDLDISAKDRWGYAPLNYAENLDIVRILLNHGAKSEYGIEYYIQILENRKIPCK